MILSVSPFFNELDLLEIKLQTLKEAVDAFLVCEATRTYSGIHKPLHFAQNKNRFREFNIHHLVVDNLPGLVANPWDREKVQRDAMYQAAIRLKPDIILWGDTDEVTRPEAVREFVRSRDEAWGLDYDCLRYYFNRLDPRPLAVPRVISRDGRHHIRNSGAMPVRKDSGWHFNFCTDRQTLLDKVNATSHVVDSGSDSFWNAISSGTMPELELTVPYPEEKLPRFITDNRARSSTAFFLKEPR